MWKNVEIVSLKKSAASFYTPHTHTQRKEREKTDALSIRKQVLYDLISDWNCFECFLTIQQGCLNMPSIYFFWNYVLVVIVSKMEFM